MRRDRPILLTPIRIAMLAIVLAAVGLWLWTRHERDNTWTITNAPVEDRRVLCMGDSLVAGVGAETPDHTYPAQLASLLGVPVQASGVRGETTASALGWLDRLPARFDGVVVITLGGNDILRRIPPEESVANLRRLFKAWQQRGAVVAFTGVHGPLSGARGKHYRALCRELGVIYVDDILGGILDTPDLKADRIHPNGNGYALMAERVAAPLAVWLGTSPSEDL